MLSSFTPAPPPGGTRPRRETCQCPEREVISSSQASQQPGKTYPRDGLDLGPKFLLDSVERKPVIVGDQVDGNTQVAKSSKQGMSYKDRSSDASNITFHCGQSCGGRSRPSLGSRS